MQRVPDRRGVLGPPHVDPRDGLARERDRRLPRPHDPGAGRRGAIGVRFAYPEVGHGAAVADVSSFP